MADKLRVRTIRIAHNAGPFFIIIDNSPYSSSEGIGFYNNLIALSVEFRDTIRAFLCADISQEETQMKICMVGQGAFAKKHLDGLARIKDAQVVTIYGKTAETTKAVAEKYAIPHWTTDFDEALAQPGLEAVILTSPTQVHAEQAIKCLRAGKHVEIEIPISDSLADAEKILAAQKETGLIAMGGHTRRFNPSHQFIHKKIQAGELKLQHLVVQTFFFRRTNMNAEGKPRSWTDHLLWHHACHTVDLLHYQTGQTASVVGAVQGPMHPELGIAMDMSVQMKVPSGAVCTLALSFNNNGPLGTWFRYICDNGTYVARYDELVDGYEKQVDVSKVDVSMDGIELQDREFLAAIQQKREPNSSVAQVMPAMRVLDRLEKSLR